MLVAPLAENEAERLAALHQYGLYGTAPEPSYEDIVRLLATICGTSTALVSLIGEDQLWFKARLGYMPSCGSRKYSLCGHVVNRPAQLLIVEDTLNDPRFADNPEILAQNIRFYAAAPLTTPEGHVVGALCTVHDQPMQLSVAQQDALAALARQVMRNMELHLSNQVLSAHSKQLEQQTDALQQLNQSKDRFFSIIAHDLKAPFQGILGFSELLDTDLDEMSHTEIRNIASYLHDTAAGAFKLLENLLNWAMVESGRLTYQPKSLCLESVFDLVEGSLSGAARHKNIRLQLSCPKDLRLYADENMLRSMIRNLVSNAVKFTPDGGQVNVSAIQLDDRVEIQVRDTGVGMSMEQVQQILSNIANVNAQNSSTQGTSGETGTGLGLVLCQQFALRHGSHIQIESTPNQGTVFRFCLPAMVSHQLPETVAMA
ncbi:MAG: GAF domain-containing sensor histidine kinase [Pseudomonadota bacterium]|nr:GAF domain-containing sensor histidine kinase [Pseudomonadota bacterium]